MKGFTHESTKFYIWQELYWANLLNSESAMFYCYTFLMINQFLSNKQAQVFRVLKTRGAPQTRTTC